MKQQILTILVFLFFQTYGYSAQTADKILTDSSKIESLEEKVDKLIEAVTRLETERNYFETALNSQTVIYSIILSFILFIFGSVSYLNFRMEVKRNEKLFESNLSKLTNSFNSLEQDFSTKNNLVYQNIGRLSIAVAETIFKEKLTSKLTQYLMAAEFYFKSKGKNKNQTTRALLKKSYQITQKIKEDTAEVQLFVKYDHNKDIERLKTILKSDDKESVNHAVKLLHLLLNKEDWETENQ